MPWEIIITAIISVLTTGGIAAFFINPRAAKRKPEIENKNANAEADKTIVETARELMNELKEERKDIDIRYDKLEEKYDIKTKELDEANSNLVMCSMLICKHTACPLRDPGYGHGKDWLEKNLSGEESTDSISIEDIAESKGYTIKRTKKLSVTE